MLFYEAISTEGVYHHLGDEIFPMLNKKVWKNTKDVKKTFEFSFDEGCSIYDYINYTILTHTRGRFDARDVQKSSLASTLFLMHDIPNTKFLFYLFSCVSG